MRLPVSHKVVYQGCATFVTEGPNQMKQIRPRVARSFHTGCLVLVTGIKIQFVVLRLARGLQTGWTSLSYTIADAYTATTSNR